MKISELYPSKFVKAADLNGRTVILTIENLVMEKLGHGNEAENKPILYFRNATKGMVLNATNARTVAALHGDESSDWVGKRISIYPTKVRAFGQTHDVIRVKEESPPAPKPATAAPVEENEIDDAEDFADLDEGQIERIVDSETGEIIDGAPDDLWGTEEAPAKPAVLSPAKLTRITVLGADAYGKEWDENSDKLAQWASQGTRKKLSELLPVEADKLIKALEKKIEGAQAAAAKQPVTVAK